MTAPELFGAGWRNAGRLKRDKIMEFRLKLFSWRATLSGDSGSWPFFRRGSREEICVGV
jgi:hypothetical protein